MDLSSKNKSSHLRHSYRAYGLNLLSGASVPGLTHALTDTRKPDIILELGSEPGWVARALQLLPMVRCSKPAIPESGDPAFTLSALGHEEFFELAQIGLLDDPARQVLIVKKSLAETSDRRNADVPKRCADLGEPHVDIDNPCDRRRKLANLFTKSCEQNTPRE